MRSAPDVTTAGSPVVAASGVPDLAVSDAGVSDAGLLAALEVAFQHRRLIDAEIVQLAGEVVERSRSSLGTGGLASRLGETSAAAVVAGVGRIGLAEGRRLCRLGEVTRDRVSLLGEVMPAMFPSAAEGLTSGRLGVDAATHIATALTQAAPGAHVEDLVFAESALVEFAASNPADLVRALAARYRDALDVDGVEPREDELVAGRSLRRTLLPNGLKRFQLDVDPLSAAHLDASIDAAVGAAIKRVRFDDHGAVTSVSAAGSDDVPDPRTLTQIGADAIVDLARHGNTCTNTPVPTPAVTVVVRIPLDSLVTGLGTAQIDGSEQPISARTARDLAADAHLIPAVLGGDGEILDLGRTRRLFSRAQRLALAERDGGCAFPTCDRPPTWTEAHHIRWWSNDGATDLRNGVLLCTRHHHTVHDHGWGIDIRDNVPWFLPPPTVDPTRTPRRGGAPPLPLAHTG